MDQKILRNTALAHKYLLAFMGKDAYKEFTYWHRQRRQRDAEHKGTYLGSIIMSAFAWYPNTLNNYDWPEYHKKWQAFLNDSHLAGLRIYV